MAILAIVVLGCAVRLDGRGRVGPSALSRRLGEAARIYARVGTPATIVVVSGGRRWGEVVEADAMANELVLSGVPEQAIVRERCSLSTRDNARFTADILRRRGLRSAALVTCAWHVPRARALFTKAGVPTRAVPVPDAERCPLRTRLWRWGRERVLSLL
jgi:uncharacterized SAM-binding protein YcdF (DUF218 family)